MTIRPLRVLQLLNTLARTDGGPARNAFELHRTLNKTQDLRVVLVALNAVPVNDTVTAETPQDLRGGQLGSTIGLLRLVRLISQTDVVLIHGYYLGWAPLTAVTARLLRKRVALTPHGSLTAYQQQFSRERKRLFDATAGRALRACLSIVGVGSHQEATDLAEKFPALPSQVVGAGTPLLPQVTSPEPSATIRLLSISRIAPKKRVDLMIDTVSALRRDGKDASLTVAGTGEAPLLDSLMQQAAELGIQDAVHFIGEVGYAEKVMLYSSSDIFLAPSDDENFGIAVAEALGAGVPCIASPFVASAIGLTMPAGMVTNSQMTDEIAEAVKTLNREDPAARATAARSFARRQFSWPSVAGRWDTVFRAITSAQ